MAAKEFEFIEHTADIGVRAYGADLKEAFANTAKGLFSLITELDDVREMLNREIEVRAVDPESLLVEWLNELIYLFDVDNIIFKRFEITLLTDKELKARGFGEKVDKARHQIKIGFKAATYHMLQIREENNGYRTQVIFDV